jgi:hypothetical protein
MTYRIFRRTDVFMVTKSVLLPEMSVHSDNIRPITEKFVDSTFIMNELMGCDSAQCVEETCCKYKNKKLE